MKVKREASLRESKRSLAAARRTTQRDVRGVELVTANMSLSWSEMRCLPSPVGSVHCTAPCRVQGLLGFGVEEEDEMIWN